MGKWPSPFLCRRDRRIRRSWPAALKRGPAQGRERGKAFFWIVACGNRGEDRIVSEAEDPWKVVCPKCGSSVDRVDGEYARHENGSKGLCVMSKREIREENPS